ncbi:MAG: hypothetical protein J3K34DRAFT_464936 [Monoraphidium minutum]|nr:MAG: hypothetical protein J3K34DRAFT_464936 [Monoraphidium minutum]
MNTASPPNGSKEMTCVFADAASISNGVTIYMVSTNSTGLVDTAVNNTITAAALKTAMTKTLAASAAITSITQVPSLMPAGDITTNVTFEVVLTVTKASSVVSETNPLPVVTMSAESNASAVVAATGCAVSATVTKAQLRIKDDVTAVVAEAVPLCYPDTSIAANYRVTLDVTGATSIDMDGNCSAPTDASTWTNEDAGIGKRVYICNSIDAGTSHLHYNVSGTDDIAASTIDVPIAYRTLAPSIALGAITQTLMLPRNTESPAHINFLMPVTVTNALGVPGAAGNFTTPSQCVLVQNATLWTYPFTGAISFNCTYADNTMLTAGATRYIPADIFNFKLVTPNAGCVAEASRNVTVVYEPEVSAVVGPITQGCAGATGAIKYKMNVTITGAKASATASPGCVKTRGALDAAGAGELTYECTFASPAVANTTTLNFTSTGLIAGHSVTTSTGLRAPVVAAAPDAVITSGPTQGTLLAANDVTSPINYTVSVAFTGAVGGGGFERFTAPAGCVNVTDASTVDDGEGSVDFLCTFPNSDEVTKASPFKFRAQTPAADCWDEDFKAPEIVREPSVGVWFQVNQSCLADMSSEVDFQIKAYYMGAKVNYTFPAGCSEVTKPTFDVNGTGEGVYACKFANSSMVSNAAMVFSSTGLLGEYASSRPSLEDAVTAKQPTIKVGVPSQDLLKDNSSMVVYTVSVEFGGADTYQMPYNCSVPGVLEPYTYKEGLVNGSGKVTFVCTYENATVAEEWWPFTFASRTAANGCFASESVDVAVTIAEEGSTVPYVYRVRFAGMNHGQLVADDAKTLKFKTDVRTRVALGVGLEIGLIEVANLTAGSVIADVILNTPADWSPAQVNTAANIMAEPEAIFDPAFLDAYGITGVTVTVVSELPPVPGGLSDSAKIGVGVGVGIGGAAVIGGLVGVGLARKRRMAVEPRDRLANAEAGYGGR